MLNKVFCGKESECQDQTWNMSWNISST